MKQSTSTILALCLPFAAAGCAVLPMAIDRSTVPSTRNALTGLEEAQHQLDTAAAVRNKNLEAGGRSRDAHGSVSGAYTRWSNDEVKELPDIRTTVIDD